MRARFENASSPKGTTYIQGTFARAFRWSKFLRSKAVTAGQIAEYMNWQETRLSPCPKLWSERERLWFETACRLSTDKRIVVFEFGVAWGYATNWWITHLNANDITSFEWHGFDRFTGLPRAWREHAAGAYDVGGKPPDIHDDRVHWHVGDVEDTLAEVDFYKCRDAQWLILFDLDLYEPTSAAWTKLRPHLNPGDLLYFDEAMDSDERRILDEQVLPAGSFDPIGTTALALALEIRSIT